MASKRVLLIEDDPDLASLMLAALTLDRYETRLEANGRAGLATAGEFSPDAVVLDLMLPGQPEGGLHAALRRRLPAPKIPIVLVTVLSERDALKHVRLDGHTYYVPKPFRPDEFLAVLRQALAIAAG